MYELSVKNNRGYKINFTNNDDYTVRKITGLNPPAATIASSDNSTSDGIKVNRVKITSRNIVIYADIETPVEDNRINLYKYFPVKGTVTLHFRNGIRDVYIDGVVELIECDLFEKKQVAQISIICPQPYFSAVNEIVEYFSHTVSQFEFPFSIDSGGMEISKVVSNIHKTIIYTGDVENGVIIELNAIGKVEKPIIYDVSKHTRFALNCELQANDRVIINTYLGSKSVTLIRDGVSINITGYVIPDSDWFTLSVGENVFRYECGSGGSNLQITFTTSALYGGV